MSSIGGKAQSLIRLRDEFGANVPPFVVIAFDEAFENFGEAQTAIGKATSAYFADGNEVALAKANEGIASRLILASSNLDEVHSRVMTAGWTKVSFRTSASIEDGPEASFAGQYESFVDVDYSRDALEKHALACFESMISLRVLRYARERKLAQFEIGGSFIVQQMFYGTSSGVLFTENGTGAVAVQAVGSWRNTVVEGSDAHEYVVEREHLSNADVPSFVRELCTQALAIEAKVGHPLDIEWSTDGNAIMFLQMRPITVPNLNYELDWDSTNISENYQGITLPLTYSVIRELYAGVYMSFLRMIGTPEKMLIENEAKFRNMLGYLNGQVYYRITNWYELLKLLPGRTNQEFFEAMLNPVVKRGQRAKGRRMDAKSAFTLLRFLWLLTRSQARSEKFRKRFAKRLAFFKGYHVEHVNVAALLEASNRVRSDLLSEWAVPILNDVKLMVFHGLLKRYFFSDDHQSEYLAFLQGLSDRASLKPLEYLSRVGAAVAKAIKSEGVASVAELRSTASWHSVVAEANDYVTAFGSRTPGELKLESVRLTDDITDVLEMALKAHESSFAVYADAHSAESAAKPAAALAWPAHVARWQRPLLRWVALNTRRAIDWRERFRFNRAQTFDLSRSMFDAVAKVFVAQGILDDARDIYWLTEQEVDEIVNAHAWSLDAKPTVAQRKAIFESYSAMHMGLAMRGAGTIAGANLVEVKSLDETDGLAGRGVAPGLLTAEVVVCTEFDPNIDVRGKILVVHHIDPGWTLLFTQAAGIVAERGNALSHAAIIAREIGIPAVVAATGATSALKTGDIVTINGILGSITRESD